MMKSILKEMVKKTQEHLKSEEFCKKHKDKPKSFTRLRCMGFVGIITLCLNFLRKSLQVEIDKYMELTDPEIEKPMTKQAFSKARHKILPEAFKELFEMTGITVAENNGFGKYRGYRIFAIDGSELQLPKSEEISAKFRQTRGSFSPHGRASILCDVITGYTVHANLDTTEVGERKLAMEHLEYFKPHKKSKDLILCDRGYPSKDLIRYLDSNGFKYLMRLQKSFNAEIDATDKSDFHVQIFGCKVRVVKLPLSTGEIEILITNLSRTAFKTDDFLPLYHLRWGVETKYNTLKNKLDIECFSGKTLVTVMQDFYATMYLSNIAAAVKAESDGVIRDENSGKILKRDYKTNENILIGKLKDKLIMILLSDNNEQRQLLLDKLVLQVARYRTAIVPERSSPRPVSSHKRAVCRVKKSL
jgi:hypothetical protein